ncbi:MAG TPA: hypothetical protein VGJ05_05710 [Fimbriiglobus sp.]|jgi:hypothetical protein
MRTRLVFAALFAALLAAPADARTCPFCSSQGQTLLGELNQADFILYGSLQNAKQDPDDPTQGTTDLVIEEVIKDHPYLSTLKGKNVITLPRYVPPDPASKAKTLIFCSLYAPSALFPAAAIGSGMVMGTWSMQKVDPYHGLPVLPDSKIPEYLKGVQAIRDKDNVTRLKFFFKYLESPEIDISNDAFLEFGQASYQDVKAVCEKLPPGTVLKWIKDPNTLSLRLGMYGLMAGHTGSAEDAKTLRSIIDDPNRQYSSGLDGLICGYVMLDKKAGWEYLTNLLKDKSKDFTTRYAGIRVLRFMWDFRSDHIPKDQILEAIKIPLSQPDVADLPIEDLRKWKQWQLAGVILDTIKKEKHAKEPLVVRAATRYFLAAPPGTKGAAEFIAQRRKADPEGVKDIEELLALEKAAADSTKAANAGATPPPVANGKNPGQK